MKPDDFADIDTKRPSGARMYDYMLGGTDNYAIDRTAIDQVEKMLPGTTALARNNRRFLERVVRYLADDRGIRHSPASGPCSAASPASPAEPYPVWRVWPASPPEPYRGV